MAEQNFYTQALSWGRVSDGRFVIQINMQASNPQGKLSLVPVSSFLLTHVEEEALKASLFDLHMATNGIKAN